MLLIILAILVVVDTYVNNKTFGGFVELDEQFQSEVEQFEKLLELKKEEENKKRFEVKTKEKKVAWKLVEKPFDFDPNSINKTNLKS